MQKLILLKEVKLLFWSGKIATKCTMELRLESRYFDPKSWTQVTITCSLSVCGLQFINTSACVLINAYVYMSGFQKWGPAVSEVLAHIFCPFFNCFACFLDEFFVSLFVLLLNLLFFVFFWISVLYQICVLQDFLQSVLDFVNMLVNIFASVFTQYVTWHRGLKFFFVIENIEKLEFFIEKLKVKNYIPRWWNGLTQEQEAARSF